MEREKKIDSVVVKSICWKIFDGKMFDPQNFQHQLLVSNKYSISDTHPLGYQAQAMQILRFFTLEISSVL